MCALVSRREFLVQSMTGSLVLAAVSTPLGLRLIKPGEATAEEALQPNVWVRIDPDDTVTVAVNKCEMGQGVYTALPMIVADELGADWDRVQLLEVPVGKAYIDPVWGFQGTGGSTSVRHMHEPLRRAAAAAREMLVAAAARDWGVPESECVARDGKIVYPQSGRSATFGSLASSASGLSVPQHPSLRDPSERTVVGKSVDRLDLPAKVAGTARFGIDSFVDGMLYGAVARPPRFGAKEEGHDAEAARKVPGVRAVESVSTGIGVCADTLDAAWKGRQALKVRWSAGTRPDLDSESLEKAFHEALDREGVRAVERGDVDGALKGAAKVVESTYLLPYLAHTTMEPMNCTADVREDRCEVWAPTQNQTATQQLAMKVSGLPEDRVKVHTTYLGCGFGRRFETDFVEEALQLSKQAGKPVKVVWTREEDVQHDFYRPGNACRIRGGVKAGKITTWAHRVAAPSIFARVFPDQVKDGIDPAAVEGIENTPYEIPNLRVDYVRLDLPVPVGFWRSVGNSHNGFTVESFVDELAHAAGVDPLEFRLHHLARGTPSRRALELVAEKSGWGKSLPASGRARGVAQHFSFGSAVAQVAEVSVDEKSGRITVHRVVCAVDPGRIVNPDTVRAQLMGGTVMGLSAGLKEKVDFAKGGVSSENFPDYELLRMDETPEIEVHIVEGGGEIGGIGEPGVPPAAPAVANAVFAATGARLRRLPMTPKVVKESVKG